MLDNLTQRLAKVVKTMRGEARLTEANTAGLPGFAHIAVGRFELTPFETLIAVAPKRSKKFPEFLAHYRELRDRGIAD